MLQDYRLLSFDQLESLEKQTLRMLVQAVQDYSREARLIFQNTPAPKPSELTVLAEDLVQYALEVAECFPINRRFAGFIDYKRVRWMPTGEGLIAQALLVDAKASTEGNRLRLQLSQLPMTADLLDSVGTVRRYEAGLPEHLDLHPRPGSVLTAVSTSAFVHYFYQAVSGATLPPYRTLKAIYVVMLPHRSLKAKYNPDHNKGFFTVGPEKDDSRGRVSFERLIELCPWRVQVLKYDSPDPAAYSRPVWRDTNTQTGAETETPFEFFGR